MSRILIELYLDEDVDVLIAELLRSRGLRATTTREAEMLGAGDADQLDYAARHELAMMTHNRVHFEKLVEERFSTGQSHSGVVIAVRRPPYEIAKRLLVVLNKISADEMKNRVVYI